MEPMRETESSLQQFDEFLLKRELDRTECSSVDRACRFNVETTMVHTHVVKELRNPARSPLDMLQERSTNR